MRPLGVIFAACIEFLRAVLIALAAPGVLLPRLLHMRPVSGQSALLNLAVVVYPAQPEARRYFELKESAPPNAA